MSRIAIPNMPLQSTPTNCFTACLASLLNIPISQVPPGADGASWNMEEVQEWMADTFALQILEMTFANGGTLYPMREEITCVITGKSPRECVTGRHAVVAVTKGLEGFEIIHDPHPSKCGLVGDPTHASFLVPINPFRYGRV